MDDDRHIYRDGAVAIRDRIVEAVGTDQSLTSLYEGARVLDAKGAVVHPGFIDSHVHAGYVNSRGAFPDTASLPEALRVYARWLNANEDEDEYASCLLACLEMVRNGTTCFVEPGSLFEPEVGAAAAAAVGIRVLLGDPFLWDVSNFFGERIARAPVSTKRALGLLGSQLRRNENVESLSGAHVCLWGVGTASTELEVAAKTCADEHDALLTQHQSFSSSDVAEDEQRFGMAPIVHFAHVGVLGPNCVFTHMNSLHEVEQPVVVESGMSVVWCPSSTMLWGVGGVRHGNHDELHRRGVSICLGSDAANSAGRFDLSRQADLALMTSRDKRAQRDALSVYDVLEMMTIRAAKALQLDGRLGSIEPGKRADLVLRESSLPEAQPELDPVQGIMLSTGPKSVDTVIVNGEIVVRRNHSTRVDEELVYDLIKSSARRVCRRADIRIKFGWPVVD